MLTSSSHYHLAIYITHTVADNRAPFYRFGLLSVQIEADKNTHDSKSKGCVVQMIKMINTVNHEWIVKVLLEAKIFNHFLVGVKSYVNLPT